MKILNISDLHLRSSNIVKRKDNYEKTIFSKVNQIFSKLAKDADVVCFPGDIFDSFRASNKTIRKMMKILLDQKNVVILGVYGQHDLQFRNSDFDILPIGLLETSRAITFLNHKPYKIGNVDFYGANFGEEVPKIQNPDNFNILVIHTMVIDQKLWNKQEDYISSRNMLRRYDFDLILSGDNHQSHDCVYKHKTLINGGCILRNASNQENHKPRVVLFDTDTRGFESRYLDVAPFSEVFDVAQIKDEKESNKSLQELADLLKMEGNIIGDRRQFEELVLELSENENKGVKDILNEVFEDVENNKLKEK